MEETIYVRGGMENDEGVIKDKQLFVVNSTMFR